MAPLSDFDRAFERRKEEARLQLLLEELKLAGINMRSVFPDWAESKDLRDSLLRELLIALDAPVHEGLIPPYGSLVVPKDQTFDQRLIPIGADALTLARKASDGRSGLLVFQEANPLGLLLVDPSSTPDLQLANLAREMDGVAFRRERSGVVRVYSLEGALRYAGRQWRPSPSISEAQSTVLKAAPMVDRDLLAGLLSFAYYVLSPWYVGSTLVWLLTDEDPFNGQGVDLRPLRLNVRPDPTAPSVAFAAHLLAQFDGATVVDVSGNIVRTNIQLTASEKALALIKPYYGTRHTSARRASFDLDNSIIVTVSDDGPVTIFSDGLSVLELWFYSADREAIGLRKLRGESAEDSGIGSSSGQALCDKCGKTSNLEVVFVPGWTADEAAYCPLCGNRIASQKSFNIHANIVKILKRS